MTPTISVTGLSRRYRGQAALDNVSLTVEPGTVTGLLAVATVVTLTHSWTAFGHFFTTVQAPALTGVLAAFTLALGLGGFATVRRATI